MEFLVKDRITPATRQGHSTSCHSAMSGMNMMASWIIQPLRISTTSCGQVISGDGDRLHHRKAAVNGNASRSSMGYINIPCTTVQLKDVRDCRVPVLFVLCVCSQGAKFFTDVRGGRAESWKVGRGFSSPSFVFGRLVVGRCRRRSVRQPRRRMR